MKVGIPSTSLDLYGGAASVLCAVHCAAMPFLGAFLPLLGLSFLASETTDYVLLAITAVLASTSLFLGYRKHKSIKAFPFVLIGLGLIVAGHLKGHDHSHHGHGHHDHSQPEFPLALVLGGLCVAASHGLNHHLCKSCPKCVSAKAGSNGDEV